MTHSDPVSAAAEVERLLVEMGATVAVAESLTGGLLGATFTAVPGSSRTFRGGVIAYATDLKERVLDVPGPLLAAEGAVSAHVAAAMAAGVRDRLAATYGVALTGVAGPDEQDGKPAGTVFVAVAGPGDGQVRELTIAGDRQAVRSGAVDAAIELLRDLLDRAGTG